MNVIMLNPGGSTTGRRTVAKKRKKGKKKRKSSPKRKRKASGKRKAKKKRKSPRKRRATATAVARASNPKRKKKKGRKKRRRNPAKVAFGLPRGLAKLPLVGDVFLEENLYTGVGIGVGFGFIPMIEERVHSMLGLDAAAWYGDPTSWQRRALDTLGPVAVGGIGFAVSRAVKMPALRKIGKGFAMAGIGYGVGRIVADLIYPMLPAEAQPTVALPRAGAADYLPYREGAGSFLAERGGAADYLPYREGAGSFIVDRGGAAELDEQIYN